MREPLIPRTYGREAFGRDPAGYDAARPPYPEWVFEFLRDRCGLLSGTATFEIGSGTGTATRRLLEFGANPLVAIEPDVRLVNFLQGTVSDRALKVIVAPFEEAVLENSSFDLGLSATSFHWIDEHSGLNKAASLLRPGGWWAMLWNVFGDSTRPDLFHEATKCLLGGPLSPSAGIGEVPFALDHEARLAALERTKAFDSLDRQASTWALTLDPEQTVALYATYSNVNIRPDREDVLNELHRIARDDFQGCVTRNMTTVLYVARRRS